MQINFTTRRILLYFKKILFNPKIIHLSNLQIIYLTWEKMLNQENYNK